MTDLALSITTHHTTIHPPTTPGAATSIPTFIFHLTRLKGTLMIWVGTAPATGSLGVDEDDEAGEGSTKLDRRLGSDWAVAMPARGNIPVSSTSLYQTGATSIAMPMSQRLARKFPPYQIHLSLSLPPDIIGSGGMATDMMASRKLMLMEKKLGTWLEQMLGTGSNGTPPG